jgi:aspartate-semialdehyde dehydrogenase
MVVALKPIHDRAGLKRVFVATYQAVSGTGAKAITELETQLAAHVRGERLAYEVYPAPIALNVIPQVDVFLEDGYTKEEMKMVYETQKIMGLPHLPISATCVRVPVIRAHSEALQIETERPISAEEAKEAWRAAPGVKLLDEHRPGGYPMPRDVAGSFDTYIGRIRKDISLECGLSCWVVADQLLKGAALNAVQIAQHLFKVPSSH